MQTFCVFYVGLEYFSNHVILGAQQHKAADCSCCVYPQPDLEDWWGKCWQTESSQGNRVGDDIMMYMWWKGTIWRQQCQYHWVAMDCCNVPVANATIIKLCIVPMFIDVPVTFVMSCFDLTITNPDHQGVQDPSPTFDDHWQQLVWEGQACAAAAYYVTGILVQPWARKTSQLYRWLRNLLIMKVGRRRTERLCQRLVIKLTSCSSRLWHLPLLLSMLDTASCNG